MDFRETMRKPCGDVNGQFPFTHVAGYEAGIALTKAILHLLRKVDYGRIGWCTYTDPEVASIGFNEKRACSVFDSPLGSGQPVLRSDIFLIA